MSYSFNFKLLTSCIKNNLGVTIPTHQVFIRAIKSVKANNETIITYM